MSKPKVLLDPHPRLRELILDDGQWRRLNLIAHVIEDRTAPMPDETVERCLPETVAIIGQTPLPLERIARAPKLRAVINVEGNFYQNVDYHACFERGINVLSIAPAFAVPVAEMAVALALDLARGVTVADSAMRSGGELYGSAGNTGAVLLSRARAGIIGYGNVGRALRRLLAGFSAQVQAYDPWLPDNVLREDNVEPAPLETLMSSARFIFILAGVTSENQGFLGRRELEMISADSIVVLASRAGVVDFDAFLSLAEAGRYRAATDVFPNEPVPADSPVRKSRLLLSPHRAGGMPATMRTIGEMVLDDLELILRGLPPVRLQPARRETILKMRSLPAQSYAQPTVAKA
jgi:phosphoglycerate dehydrogenase-like enzyme